MAATQHQDRGLLISIVVSTRSPLSFRHWHVMMGPSQESRMMAQLSTSHVWLRLSDGSSSSSYALSAPLTFL